MYQQSVWNNFSLINCQNWYYKNTVMLEDAAHTIHFSVGSGIGLGGEKEINLGPVRLKTEQRRESTNGSPQMGYQRKGEHVNVRDDVNLQTFLNNRIVEINPESQKSVPALKTQKVGSHGFL